MTIHRPADLDASTRPKVENGRFPDPAEVIRTDPRLPDEQERQIASLQAKLHIGLDQADRGELAEWMPELRERIRQSAHRRLALGEQPDPDVCP